MKRKHSSRIMHNGKPPTDYYFLHFCPCLDQPWYQRLPSNPLCPCLLASPQIFFWRVEVLDSCGRGSGEEPVVHYLRTFWCALWSNSQFPFYFAKHKKQLMPSVTVAKHIFKLPNDTIPCTSWLTMSLLTVNLLTMSIDQY